MPHQKTSRTEDWGLSDRHNRHRFRNCREGWAELHRQRRWKHGAGATVHTDGDHQYPGSAASIGVCNQRSRIKFRGVVDGLSQTYSVREKQVPFTRYRNGGDMGDSKSAYSGNDRDSIR